MDNYKQQPDDSETLNSNSQNKFDASTPGLSAAADKSGLHKVPKPGDRPDSGQKGNKTQYLLKNLSTTSVCMQFRNENFLQTPYLGVEGETIEFQLKIVPNNERLNLQANSWAKKLAQNAEIDFYRLGLGRNMEQWVPNLMKCFIYSYYKNLIHGLTTNRIPEDESTFFCVPGHHILYCALKKPYHTFEVKDVTVRYSLRATQEEYDSIIVKAKKLDFLKDHIVDDGVWTYVNNPKIEQYLGRLRMNVSNKDPKIWDFSNVSSSNNSLTRESFPLFNSCYTSDEMNLDKWFYMFDKTEEITSSSTLFGKSLFLHARDDKHFKIYCHTVDIADSKNYLIRYECRSVGASDKYPTPEVDAKS